MVRQYIQKLPKSIEEAAEWYMRFVSPAFLVVAFLIDTFFLLRRVDTLLTSLVLFFYLSLAAMIIVLISLIQTGRLRQWWILKITPFLPVVSQYAFGGLFIAFFSLYSRSASFAVTWIFVAALAILLVANERFVKFYMRFTFQIGILFFVLFSFLIFYLPLIFHTIGAWMFVASGIVSLLVIAAFLRLQYWLTPELVRSNITNISRAVAVIFVAFNILYFSNAIPPLPLALKSAGVYHNVVRSGDEYRLFAEVEPWYREYFFLPEIFHRASGESLYAFSAVFAPSGLTTTIFHEWQSYDDEKSKWVTEETIPFHIVGGREGGYRGFSVKSSATPGLWRVNVVTEAKQVIGRFAFTIENIPERVPIEVEVR